MLVDDTSVDDINKWRGRLLGSKDLGFMYLES